MEVIFIDFNSIGLYSYPDKMILLRLLYFRNINVKELRN